MRSERFGEGLNQITRGERVFARLSRLERFQNNEEFSQAGCHSEESRQWREDEESDGVFIFSEVLRFLRALGPLFA